MKTLSETLVTLGESGLNIGSADEKSWSDALASMPVAALEFLDEDKIRGFREFCGLDAADETFLFETARMIRKNGNLRLLAWYFHWRLFVKGEAVTHPCPQLGGVLGERCGSFYLLVSLSMIPLILESHRKLGIPEETTMHTMKEIRGFADNYKRGFRNTPGMYASQFTWLKMYLGGNAYVRVGRLEFWLRPYYGGVRAYRSMKTGRVVALADPGIDFTPEGYVRSKNVPSDNVSYWTSILSVEQERVIGNPVIPEGRALEERVSLDLKEWRCVLEKDFEILDLHIPPGGGLTPEVFASSVRDGYDFFKKYFSGHKPVALVCHSWLFNPDIREALPPGANLPEIQKELYLYPIMSDSDDGLWFIFLQDKFDISTAPRETSLQRAIISYLEKGRRWRCGGMFLLTDDVESFGMQKYRKESEFSWV